MTGVSEHDFAPNEWWDHPSISGRWVLRCTCGFLVTSEEVDLYDLQAELDRHFAASLPGSVGGSP